MLRGLERVAAQWCPPAVRRLARCVARDFSGAPIYVHRPSLVQHTAERSSWGAAVHCAIDFDPAWLPPSL